jgi:hypothetical protein
MGQASHADYSGISGAHWLRWMKGMLDGAAPAGTGHLVALGVGVGIIAILLFFPLLQRLLPVLR